MSSPRTETQQAFVIKPRTTIRGHTGCVWNAVHLPSGRHIITCSDDHSLRLWDLESGAQIGEDWRDVGEEPGVITIALSPNGKAVASGGRDGKVRLWDVERREVIAKWTGHTDIVHSVCWSADGERVLSASYDRTVRVWDVETAKTVIGPILMKTTYGGLQAARYSHDTTKIAVGGQEEDFKIWDAKTGKLLSTIEHEGIVWGLTWTSDDKKLITGSHNGFIRIFDTDTWQQIATLAGHKDGIFSLYHHSRLLVSTSFDKTARLWNLDTNLPVGPPLQHENVVNGAAISADGKLLTTGCWNSNAYVWDIHTILENAGLKDILSSPDVLQDGRKQKMMDTDATRHRPRVEHAHRLPRGFFDDVQGGGHSYATPGVHSTSSVRRRHAPSSTSTSRPHAILNRFSSFFHRSQSSADDPIELLHNPSPSISQHSPRPVEVSAVRDKKSLFVARRPEPINEQAKRVKNHTWWSRCIWFICCLPTADTDGAQGSPRRQ